MPWRNAWPNPQALRCDRQLPLACDVMSEVIDLIQWPAFVVSLTSAWLVASSAKRRRNIGFWVFLFSNALWAVWAWHTSATALVALQVCLAVLNVRGLFKTDPPT
jgi:hypothetical protein